MNIDRLRELLDEIEQLASECGDGNADPQDLSPSNMHAHIDGLILQLCRQAKEELK